MSFLFNAKKYLKELQRADDQRKKRWLISASTILVIFIVMIWVVSFKLELKPSTEKEASLINDNKETFWQTISRGVGSLKETLNQEIGNIKNSINKNFENIKNKTEKTNNFSIENGLSSSTSNFTPLPKTLLP